MIFVPKVSNLIYAYQAINGNYLGIPYQRLDCQAFVEKVLADCGQPHDWKGSNDMWRHALSWRGTVAECEKQFGRVPLGAWLFTVRRDGGEVERGYHDNDGNAAHVGIRVQDGAIHSTAGGVQMCSFPDSKRWTHVGFCKYIDFSGYSPGSTKEKLLDSISAINAALVDMKAIVERMSE